MIDVKSSTLSWKWQYSSMRIWISGGNSNNNTTTNKSFGLIMVLEQRSRAKLSVSGVGTLRRCLY